MILTAYSYGQNIDDQIKYLRYVLPDRYNVLFRYDTIERQYYKNPRYGKRMGRLSLWDTNYNQDTLKYSVVKAYTSKDSLITEQRQLVKYSSCFVPVGSCMDFVIMDCYFSLPFCGAFGKNKEITSKMSLKICECVEHKFKYIESEKSLLKLK